MGASDLSSRVDNEGGNRHYGVRWVIGHYAPTSSHGASGTTMIVDLSGWQRVILLLTFFSILSVGFAGSAALVGVALAWALFAAVAIATRRRPSEPDSLSA